MPSDHKTQDLRLRRLGIRTYEPVWRAMQRFTDGRDGNTPDELWLLQHPPVYTLGQAGKPEHVLAPGDIPVIPVDRGGQVTYHGPGQLVGYTLFDLHRLGMGIRNLVSTLEQAIINLLADYGIEAGLRPGAPGVYVDDAKIAALGLRVRRGRTFHGISLNVDMDLEPFGRINPCGYPGLTVVDMAGLGATATMAEVETALADHIGRLLHYTVQPDISTDLPHE